MNIIDAGQSISLEGPDAGQVKCWFVVRVGEAGSQVVMTNEETINQLISLMTGVELPYAGSSVDATEAGLDVQFSGSEPREAYVASLGELSHEMFPVVAAPSGLGQGAPGRPRHVAKDELGYPIVPQEMTEARGDGGVIVEDDDPGEQI